MDSKYKNTYISGTWDLFHIGHLMAILRAAGEEGILIVGVNTDEYVKRIKGEPIIKYTERIAIINQIKGVGQACPHQDADDLRFIDKFLVNKRCVGDDWGKVKGQDWALEVMKERGVKVIRFPRYKGISTSIIKKRIQDMECQSLPPRAVYNRIKP